MSEAIQHSSPASFHASPDGNPPDALVARPAAMIDVTHPKMKRADRRRTPARRAASASPSFCEPLKRQQGSRVGHFDASPPVLASGGRVGPMTARTRLPRPIPILDP
jgi:hypothetical protein